MKRGKRRQPEARAVDDEPKEVILGGGPRALGYDLGELDTRFWLVEPSGNPARPARVDDKIIPWVARLKSAWRRMAVLDRQHDAIYENRALRVGGRWHAAVQHLGAVRDFDESRLFVTTSIVDTFHARMVRRQTMPAFVVDDAEYSIKQRAQDYRAWLHGKLRADVAEENRAMVIRDAIVRGDGIEYIDDGDQDVIMERSHRDEWLADPYEARHGQQAIRTLYRLRAVSRDAVAARFPDFRAQIMDAPASARRAEDSFAADWLASEIEVGARDVIDLVEAWHLPDACNDGEDSGGRKAVCIDGATLCYEERDETRFPIARYTWHAPMRGLWGSGDVERLRGIQAEINKICRDIAMNIEVSGKLMVFAPPGIEPGQLVGIRPFVVTIPGGGQRIEHIIPPPCSPAQIDYLERKITKAHDLVGAAQWFATGRSPLGNGASGVALDTMEDSLSDRHAVKEHNTGRYTVERSQALIDAARRTAKRLSEGKTADGQVRRKVVASSWMDKGQLRRLNFDDVALDRDDYEIGLEPTSQIPTTRAGKFSWISEMIAKGVIPSQYAASLYDEPDIAHVTRIQLAAMKNCERMMMEAGDPEKYPDMPTPEEWHDLPMLVEYAKAYFNRAQCERAPEEVQTRYREIGDAAIALMKKATPEAPALPPGAPPMDPMAPPPMPAGLPMPGPDPMTGAPPMAPPL